ncbi:MAG: HAD-IIIA family hydrolase [Syntrophales bacterium]|nr:HAD-IIIA family hydrolase [Syntrophales bacterium]
MGKEVMTEELLKKIRQIRLLILDVDGVLTDGRIIMDDTGRETKNFDVKDGHGLKILMRHGIDVVFLTGRRSEVVEHRAKDLGIGEVHQGIWNKVEPLEEILRRRNLARDHVAYVGDDVVDIPLLKRVGFSVAVADASEDVKKAVDYVTKKNGGRGAVREVCEIILKAQEKWDEVATRYEFI